MKNFTTAFILIIMAWLPLDSFSHQSDTIFIDLGDEKYKGEQISLSTTGFVLINKTKNISYQTSWKKERKDTPTFKIPSVLGGGPASALKCDDPAIEKIITKLANAKSEKEVKEYVKEAQRLLDGLANGVCKTKLSKEISYTQGTLVFPFKGKLSYNEVVTLTVVRSSLDDEPVDIRTYVFDTPEKDRWLIHYGLTYAPSAISQFSRYHVLADTSSTNKYTVKKENKNGPKPWDNISATINFTYPFHSDSRSFDGGFTGGFGLSTGFEVSGHAGLSMIIGQNIIVSSGIVMMQKYKLNGEYKEGDVVKTNLNFEALHTKVWVPELFFTIGFRFGSNPFAAKKTSSEPKKEE